MGRYSYWRGFGSSHGTKGSKKVSKRGSTVLFHAAQRGKKRYWLIDWLRPERMDEEWMNWLGMADDHSNYIRIPVLYVNPELDFNQL